MSRAQPWEVWLVDVGDPVGTEQGGPDPNHGSPDDRLSHVSSLPSVDGSSTLGCWTAARHYPQHRTYGRNGENYSDNLTKGVK